MKRRDFLKKASTGAAGAAVITAAPAVIAAEKKVRWRMVASWPKALDVLFGGAAAIAERVKAMTNGNFDIRPYAAGELVGGLEVFDAVQQGTVEAGHTASYYYIGKHPAFAFDTAVPFGLNYRQQNAWLLGGGGLELMRKLYADFNIVNIPAGNTGLQMGGWFRKEVNTPADLKGLKMRIPGLGGKVMARLGVSVQVLAAGEIYAALERGAIDATEWVGPYDDEKLGFYKVAKYYYYPGWWEPAPTLSVYVNRKAWDDLPKVYQEMLQAACGEANLKMMVDYDTKNPAALARLVANGAQLRAYSDPIMQACAVEAEGLNAEIAAGDPVFKEIHDHWSRFRGDIRKWFGTGESSYINFTAKS
jgi:TRAP-type mannitol/chloroaromatic compound transport system substrate-binding protein